jgi:hypothetical protein
MKGGVNMCCEENNNECGCIQEVLKRILILQKKDYDTDTFSGCNKPFLGPINTPICYNTRPIQLFNCATGTPWTFPYTLNGTTSESNVFRIEALDNCCCTLRVLATDDEGQYVSTNDYATIDLNCVGAIKCLPDVSIDLC